MTPINTLRLKGPYFTDIMRLAHLTDAIASSLEVFNRNQNSKAYGCQNGYF